MIKQTARVFTNTSTALNMREHGWMIYSTAKEWKHGQTVAATRATTKMEGSTVSAVTSGTTSLVTRVTGGRTRLPEWGPTAGSMGDSMKANGWITTWRGPAFTLGMTGASTQASTEMTRNTVLGYIRGRMEGVMKATGARVSSTGWGYIRCRRTEK